MKTHTKHTVATALAIVLGFAATPGKAVDLVGSDVTGVNPSQLVVLSNGQKYTTLKTTGDVRVSGKFFYDTGNNGRIKKWEVWPEFKYKNGASKTVPGTWWYGESKTYPKGSRPKGIAKNLSMKVPAQVLANAAVEVCNAKAAQLRSGGLSNADIFSQHQYANFDVGLEHKVSLTGLKSKVINEGQYRFDLVVRCSKFAVSGGPSAGNWSTPEPFKPGSKVPNASQTQSRPATLAPKTRLRIGG